MPYLLLAILFVVILLLVAYTAFRGIGRALRVVDEGKRLDMAGNGMMPKLAYGLLLLLIVYATFSASGA